MSHYDGGAAPGERDEARHAAEDQRREEPNHARGLGSDPPTCTTPPAPPCRPAMVATSASRVAEVCCWILALVGLIIGISDETGGLWILGMLFASGALLWYFNVGQGLRGRAGPYRTQLEADLRAAEAEIRQADTSPLSAQDWSKAHAAAFKNAQAARARLRELDR